MTPLGNRLSMPLFRTEANYFEGVAFSENVIISFKVDLVTLPVMFYYSFTAMIGRQNVNWSIPRAPLGPKPST